MPTACRLKGLPGELNDDRDDCAYSWGATFAVDLIDTPDPRLGAATALPRLGHGSARLLGTAITIFGEFLETLPYW